MALAEIRRVFIEQHEEVELPVRLSREEVEHRIFDTITEHLSQYEITHHHQFKIFQTSQTIYNLDLPTFGRSLNPSILSAYVGWCCQQWQRGNWESVERVHQELEVRGFEEEVVLEFYSELRGGVCR